MSKRKRLTPNQKEYQSIISDLRSQAEELMKYGIRLKSPDNDVYLSEIMPTGKRPKYITKKHLSALHNILETNFLDYARTLNPKTGEMIAGKKALDIYKQKIEKQARLKLPKRKNQPHSELNEEADLILNNLDSGITMISNKYIRNSIKEIVEDSIANAGKIATAEVIKNMNKDGYTIYIVVYASNIYAFGLQYISRFAYELSERIDEQVKIDKDLYNRLLNEIEDDIIAQAFIEDENV